MPHEDTEVLIAGGAVVGLSAALFLARAGVRVTLVERKPSTLRHPRARVINPRTVEVYRSVGLEETIVAAQSLTSDLSTKTVIRARTLDDAELFSMPMRNEAPGLSEATPCDWCSIDQNRLEEIVADHAVKLGADVRYSTELASFDDDGDGVTATVRDADTGRERRIRARYLIAADGSRSSVRRRLGIGVTGPGVLQNIVSLVFKADLSGPLRGRDLGLGYFDQPEPGTRMMPLDGSRWVFVTPYDPAEQSADDFDDDWCVGVIRAAVGVPDLRVDNIEVQIERTGAKVLGYEVAAQLAERYRQGRVFLVGDAAHAMPPTGALGAATGVQDAHNLAWKLAAVLAGDAGPALLDTYEQERRAVAGHTIDYAMKTMRDRTSTADGDEKPVSYAAIILGYRYDSAAVLPEETGGPPALEPELLGAPGTRAPHYALVRDGEPLSTLDLFGAGTVLLTGPEGGGWHPAAARAGLDVRMIGGPELADPEGRWPQAYGVSASGAVLVRPDGFVAWRAPALPTEAKPDAGPDAGRDAKPHGRDARHDAEPDVEATLRSVVARILDRG
ncbi:FAD-dependent monooxygenase [Nonomuraea cavernae]|uniref:FAD-dependent oxidoreductase n=1 Tax=Nonomuraea cavernae TaxID=2045107 RepID=A0A917ZFP7_9ACTN|nr:FAD-dependent monooxygenase [Nonomuraea cavernae]MCA2189483.1 FAD-dependent monooxygenase [Nonomuraea cavernae]GGO82135.1 FAD-dependent oxidoreductase [Nonomuraea cavernae]